MDFVEATQIEVKLRLVEENIPRVMQCLQQLSESQINHQPNTATPSVAQLVLHLNGNCRQWLLQAICGVPFHRNRKAEFAATAVSKATLTETLVDLRDAINTHLHQINADKLTQHYNIQGIKGSGFSVVVHAIEHFSYHTGQIATLTKILLNTDLGFYSHLTDIDKA